MKTNPGGQLAPDEVVGRDRLIAKLWRILERQSLVLTAERRIGKTSIIKKMTAQPQFGMRVFFRDVEALRTPLEFVNCVFEDVWADLSRKQQTMKRVRIFFEQVSGGEALGVKLPQTVAPHWKTLLTKTIEDLAEQQAGLIVFCWDEMPMMLDNIKRDQSESLAMEVLDVLRSLRQMIPNLRMVFTGSIGLHHVIARLKETGYANSPINDMFVEDVAPLALIDACDLAEKLLRGEQIRVVDERVLAQAIAEAVDCFPFYIHHVVDALKWTDEPQTADLVAKIVQMSLCDDANRWDLAHFRVRINTYYSAVEQPLVLGILDELAATGTPLLLRELLERLNLQQVVSEPEAEAEAVRKLLDLLRRDHYIVQQPDSTYRFKFGLIQRYWQLRGL
ncbi:MAG: ATP-binding protein [Aphanocapsa sp. GSE-SYN-MK-11-07L]|jgi:hypothetical protein|nr:ATP-binding protein [Aphanocapsa sp. GSE-SYN-MK-11-07L]